MCNRSGSVSTSPVYQRCGPARQPLWFLAVWTYLGAHVVPLPARSKVYHALVSTIQHQGTASGSELQTRLDPGSCSLGSHLIGLWLVDLSWARCSPQRQSLGYQPSWTTSPSLWVIVTPWLRLIGLDWLCQYEPRSDFELSWSSHRFSCQSFCQTFNSGEPSCWRCPSLHCCWSRGGSLLLSCFVSLPLCC